MMFLFCQLAPNRHFSDKDVKFSWRNFDAHLTTCPLKDYALFRTGIVPFSRPIYRLDYFHFSADLRIKYSYDFL